MIGDRRQEGGRLDVDGVRDVLCGVNRRRVRRGRADCTLGGNSRVPRLDSGDSLLTLWHADVTREDCGHCHLDDAENHEKGLQVGRCRHCLVLAGVRHLELH